MIINNAPANEAILSNVGEVGEFRIRNSAKAFNILSSGLYANKIRAIIRELSCNAVDSHAAAGKKDTPFDVHLPTQLEPTFSIRDYGTGLSHEQVKNIYTTYFESTKTMSNEFIGALGLGSKSPFSYTDNFTVTAIQNGHKGVYSAFINAEGVPSIALMMEEDTTDPNGVEIKFAVEDRWDFDKFRSEARTVYTYFALRPVVSGPEFTFRDVEYETKDIVPGVHSCQGGGCRAVMGNISYPIDIPNAESNLGELAKLLNCGLEMHFAIGELDFQASREGLSYIPQTIEAIKRKLEAVNAALAVVVAQEADAITNHWDRADWLIKKGSVGLWHAAVIKYIADTEFKLVTAHGNYLRAYEHKFFVDDLSKKYNINILGFSKSPGSATCSTLKSHTEYDNKAVKPVHKSVWSIPTANRVFFVENDTKVGALERAKFHWRNGGAPAPNGTRYYDDQVLVLNPVDRTKPMNTKAFFKALNNPPKERRMVASSLKERARKVTSGSLGANVTIMRLEERGTGGYYASKEMVWRDAGKADSFDSAKTYYYLPLSGFNVISQGVNIYDVKEFYNDVTRSGIPGLQGITIYGVRKTDHKWVAGQKNWVNIQEHLKTVLATVDAKLVSNVAEKELDVGKQFKYNEVIARQVSADSMYAKFSSRFKGARDTGVSRASLEKLCKQYGTAVDVESIVQALLGELTAVKQRYPLLSSLKDYDINSDAVAQYINLIDKEVK